MQHVEVEGVVGVVSFHRSVTDRSSQENVAPPRGSVFPPEAGLAGGYKSQLDLMVEKQRGALYSPGLAEKSAHLPGVSTAHGLCKARITEALE